MNHNVLIGKYIKPDTRPQTDPNEQEFELEESTEVDSLSEIFNIIKTELDKIDSDTIIQDWFNVLAKARKKAVDKLENSSMDKTKINDILENNLKALSEFFVKSVKETNAKKNEVTEILHNGINHIRDHILSLLESIDALKEKNEQLKANELKEVLLDGSAGRPTGQSSFNVSDEFVAILNNLSKLIKDLMKSSKICLSTARISADTIAEQITPGKAIISDTLLQTSISSSSLKGVVKKSDKLVPSMGSGNNIGTSFNVSKDKQTRDKFTSLTDKLNTIEVQRILISNSIKKFEQENKTFYDNAKLAFKKLKDLHSKSLDVRDIKESTSKDHTVSREATSASLNNRIATPNKSTANVNVTTVSNTNNQRISSQSPIARNPKRDSSESNQNIKTTTGSNQQLKGRLSTESDYLATKSNQAANQVNSMQHLKKQTANESFSLDEKKALENQVQILKKNINEMKDEIEVLNNKYKKIKKDYIELKQKNERSTQLRNLPREIKGSEEKSKTASRSISPNPVKPTGVSKNNYVNPSNSEMANTSLKNPHRLAASKPKNAESFTETFDTSGNLDRGSSLDRANRSKSKKRPEAELEEKEKTLSISSGNPLENLWKLSEDVEDFIKKMNELQKALHEKNPKSKDMKVSFENKKQDILSFVNIVLKSKSSQGIQQKLNESQILSLMKAQMGSNLAPKPNRLKFSGGFGKKSGLEDSSANISMDFTEKKKLEDHIEKLKDENDSLRKEFRMELDKFTEEHKRWVAENELETKLITEENERFREDFVRIEEENRALVIAKSSLDKELRRLNTHIEELKSEKQVLNITIQTQGESLKKNHAIIERLSKRTDEKEKLTCNQLQSQVNELQVKYDYIKKLNEEYTLNIERLNEALAKKNNESPYHSPKKTNDDQIIQQLEKTLEAKNKNIRELTHSNEELKQELVRDKIEKKKLSDNLAAEKEAYETNYNLLKRSYDILNSKTQESDQIESGLSNKLKEFEQEVSLLREANSIKDQKIKELNHLFLQQEDKLKVSDTKTEDSLQNVNHLTQQLLKEKQKIKELEQTHNKVIKELETVKQAIQRTTSENEKQKKILEEKSSLAVLAENAEKEKGELASEKRSLEIEKERLLSEIKDFKYKLLEEKKLKEDEMHLNKNLKEEIDSLKNTFSIQSNLLKKQSEDKGGEISTLLDEIKSLRTKIEKLNHDKKNIIDENFKEKSVLQKTIERIEQELKEKEDREEKLSSSIKDLSTIKKNVLEVTLCLYTNFCSYSDKITNVNRKEEITELKNAISQEIQLLEKTLGENKAKIVEKLAKLFNILASEFHEYVKNVDELIVNNENLSEIMTSYQNKESTLFEKLKETLSFVSSHFEFEIGPIETENIDELLSLNQEKLLTLISNLNDELSEKKVEFNVKIEEASNSNMKLKEETEKLRQEVEILRQDIGVKSQEIGVFVKNEKIYKANEAALNQELKILQGRLKSLTDENSSKANIEQEISRIANEKAELDFKHKSSTKELNDLSSLHEKLAKEKEKVEKDLSQLLNKEIESSNEKSLALKELAERLETLDKQYEKLKNEKAKIEQEKSSLTEDLLKAQRLIESQNASANNMNADLRKSFDNAQNENHRLSEEVKLLKSSIEKQDEEMKKKREELKKNGEKLDNFIIDFKNVKTELTEVKKEKQTLETEISERKEEITQLKMELAKVKEQSEERFKELESLRQNNANKEKDKLSTELKLKSESEKVKEERDRLKIKCEQEAEEINKLKEDIENAKKEITSLKDKAEQDKFQQLNLSNTVQLKTNELNQKALQLEILTNDNKNLECSLKKERSEQEPLINFFKDLKDLFARNDYEIDILKNGRVNTAELQNIIPSVLEIINNAKQSGDEDNDIDVTKSSKLLGIFFKDVTFFLINKDKTTLQLSNLVWKEAESIENNDNIETDDDYVLLEVEDHLNLLITYKEELDKKEKEIEDLKGKLEEVLSTNTEVSPSKELLTKLRDLEHLKDSQITKVKELENALETKEKQLRELLDDSKDKVTIEQIDESKNLRIRILEQKLSEKEEVENELESTNKKLLSLKKVFDGKETEFTQLQKKYDALCSKHKDDPILDESKGSPKKDISRDGKSGYDVLEDEITRLELELKKCKEECKSYISLLEKINKEAQNLHTRIKGYDDTKAVSNAKARDISFEVDENDKTDKSNSETLYEKINNEIFKEFGEINTDFERLFKKFAELKSNTDQSKYRMTIGDVVGDECHQSEQTIAIKELYYQCHTLLVNSLKGNNEENNSNNTQQFEDKNIVELFNLLNQEISDTNENYERKIKKNKEKYKKYKTLSKELKERLEKQDKKSYDQNGSVISELNTPQFNYSQNLVKYDPENWDIISEVQISNFKWFLLTHKALDETNVTYNDFAWIASTVIKEELFEKIELSNNLNEKINEIEELTKVNEDLRTKLSDIFDKYELMMKERDRMLEIAPDSKEEMVEKIKYEMLLNAYNDLKNQDKSFFCTKCKNLSPRTEKDKKKLKPSKGDEFMIEKDVMDLFGPQDDKKKNEGEEDDDADTRIVQGDIDNNLKNFLGGEVPEDSHLDDNEKILVEQLNEIKNELRNTRKEKDAYKLKYEESVAKHDINLVQSTFEKLVVEINWSQKIRELIIMILKLLNFSEETILNIIQLKEPKKKNFFQNLFK